MPPTDTAEGVCFGGPWDGEFYPVIGSIRYLRLPDHRGEYVLGKRPGERGEWWEWCWTQKR